MRFGTHEPSPLHTWRLKSQHHENSSSISTTPTLPVSCTRTLRELHPPPPALLPSSCFWALVSLFLGVVWLYLPPFFACASLPGLLFALSATPACPSYRRLGVQFAVGENLSTGYVRFLCSLHSLSRLPRQTRTRLTIVSTVIESTPPLPPQGFVPLVGYCYSPFTRLVPYCLRHPRDCHGRAPWLRSVVVLHCLGCGC